MSKTVLVTGATTGTGYCVAKKFFASFHKSRNLFISFVLPFSDFFN